MFDIADDHEPWQSRAQHSIPANRPNLPGVGEPGPAAEDLPHDRPPVTEYELRPTVPVIGTLPYAGRVVAAGRATFGIGALQGTSERIGYKGGAPSPGLCIVIMNEANATESVGRIGIVPSRLASSLGQGFWLPAAVSPVPVVLTLPVGAVTVRVEVAATTAPMSVNWLVVANERQS